MHMMHGDRVMQDSDSAQSMGMMNGTSTMDMSGIMHGMMMGLQGQTGDAFDRTFLSGMIVHHQGAVTMAQAVLQKSKRPELIKLAQDIISAQTTEINQMQTWQKNWFPVGK
jgi:uncharacterized protein (DUF305 family)